LSLLLIYSLNKLFQNFASVKKPACLGWIVQWKNIEFRLTGPRFKSQWQTSECFLHQYNISHVGFITRRKKRIWWHLPVKDYIRKGVPRIESWRNYPIIWHFQTWTTLWKRYHSDGQAFSGVIYLLLLLGQRGPHFKYWLKIFLFFYSCCSSWFFEWWRHTAEEHRNKLGYRQAFRKRFDQGISRKLLQNNL
jgi:hypothetical protein